MRLNRVELFYALVATIGSESRRYLRGRGGHMHDVYIQRWLATARPPVGRPAMAWLPTRGGRLRPGPLQEVIARKGWPPSGTVDCGQPYRQQGRWRRSQVWPPLGRAAAGCKGQPSPAQGQRRWRRSEGEGG
ncbi:hypothetical protein GW17_00039814 [Ensete ventricosum]|nr:hypothetical protein GW17_00039814 [Ensete ventricosum]RZS05603.1 hypothetical protein BHM03_00036136 [Ensete ventricosum]